MNEPSLISNETLIHSKNIYQCGLRFIDNDFCRQCQPEHKQPLLPWIVGKDYWNTPDRIMIVGKPHRGTPGIDSFDNSIDPTTYVATKLWNMHWAYWSYTRAIMESLYGIAAMDSFVFTNIVKCSNTDGADSTTENMKQNCIDGFNAIWREINYFKPKNLIFYTGQNYTKYLDVLPFMHQSSMIDAYPKFSKIKCGNKKIDWWIRIGETSWGEKMKILVTSHPERKNKNDFTNEIVNWIRNENG